MSDSQEASPAPNRHFLPDFCAGRAALAVVLIVELVALMIAMARQSITQSFWVDLAAISMFLLWIGLGSAFVLCGASPWLHRQSIAKASTVALLLLASVVALVSEGVYQLGFYLTGGVPGLHTVFPAEHASFVLRNVGIGFIVSAGALRYFYVSAEWKRTIVLEAQSRIRALQARIRPHFLFNSMNTIAALTRSDPQLAEQAVEDLADLFRANLSDAKQRIPLSDEIEVARVYERIERLRLGDRLHVKWTIGELPRDVMVPSLLLQPLLENAIYHGIERLPGGGEVAIDVQAKGQAIHIEVSNPLVAAAPAEQRTGNRLALDNIAQRLELAWPGAASVSLDHSDDRYTVKLEFPYSNHPE